MPLKLGSTSIGSLYLGSTKIGKAYIGSTLVYQGVNYNPLNLPAYTIRLKFKNSTTPTFSKGTKTRVSTYPNVWDLTTSDTSWYGLLKNQTNLSEILGANSTGIYTMSDMCMGCTSLTTVALFDTSSNLSFQNAFSGCSSLVTVPKFDTSRVTNMNATFYQCSSLSSVPLFNTSSVTTFRVMFMECSSLSSVPLFNTSSATDMYGMFWVCHNVSSGALALYQQASTQTTPPSAYSNCFKSCGDSTVTGAQELAQIPSSWGGTGA